MLKKLSIAYVFVHIAGYNGALNQSDDHGYYNADGSYTVCFSP